MKILIAFFSHKGENYFPEGYRNLSVGNAEIIADKIRQITGGEVFEIDTIKKYPNGYGACCNEAKAEQERGELPELSNYLESLDEFEKIILVYPCWWGTMPQAVFTFLNHYDFSGKQIYPVCTHEGSGMGRSESDLKRVCNNSTVGGGLAVYGHNADTCDDELKKWLKKNNLCEEA